MQKDRMDTRMRNLTAQWSTTTLQQQQNPSFQPVQDAERLGMHVFFLAGRDEDMRVVPIVISRIHHPRKDEAPRAGRVRLHPPGEAFTGQLQGRCAAGGGPRARGRRW